MKTDNKLSAYILRGSTAALLFSCVLVALCSAIHLPNNPPEVLRPQDNAVFGANAHQRRSLSFAERVAYQRAIEDVYWRHRIWPNTNAGPKPSLDEMMSQEQLEKKVEGYLCNSQVLQDYWQRPITAGELQAEMERMASHSKQPEVLRELFEALGNDPFVIAECLARPVLAERFTNDAPVAAEPALNASRRGVPAAPAVVVMPLRGIEQNVPQARGYSERQEVQVPVTMAAVSPSYTLPVIATPSLNCMEDTWTATTLTNAPDARNAHTAVWTGSEMIVWGGYDNNGASNTGGRYSPSTDSWTATSLTNAPASRAWHTAVWTGSEMIVWGGYNQSTYFNTGGRYNPNTDSWTATSVTNAPDVRRYHAAVWTGSEMIVWGGTAGTDGVNTGGRYNPSTDSWTATSTTNAPTARYLHTAVWTGSEVIVWGGVADNTGGRYNPSTDSWNATSRLNAPSPRYRHTAVWTDSEMIVWGGVNGDNDGGRYDPSTDSWNATSRLNAPSARNQHTAVWTGSEMIVWGGDPGPLNTGGIYDPYFDRWADTNPTNAPSERSVHTAVWTDSEMIVWGGANGGTNLNTGGRYCVPLLSYPGRRRHLPTPYPRPSPGGRHQVRLRELWRPH